MKFKEHNGSYCFNQQNILLLVTKKEMDPSEQMQYITKFTLATIETMSKIGEIKRSFYAIIAINGTTNDAKLKAIKNLIFTIRSKPYEEFGMPVTDNNVKKSESTEEPAKSNNMVNEGTRMVDNLMIEIISSGLSAAGKSTKELETLVTKISDVLKNNNLPDEFKINEIETILL